MSIVMKQDGFVAAEVLEVVSRERKLALSRREWMHRLAGYGYSVRETDEGDVIETLTSRLEICFLPGQSNA